MRPDGAIYLMRARGHTLVANSLWELGELIQCAHASDDHIELLLAYYPGRQRLERSHLEEILGALR